MPFLFAQIAYRNEKYEMTKVEIFRIKHFQDWTKQPQHN